MSTLPHSRPSQPSGFVGSLLLLASLSVWVGTISFIVLQPIQDPMLRYMAAILGGLLAGLFGGLRQAPGSIGSVAGALIFRSLTTLIASGVWAYVLQDIAKHSVDGVNWMPMVWAILVYAVCRDLFQVMIVATRAKAVENRMAEEKAALRAREQRAIANARMGNGPSVAIRDQGDSFGYLAGSADGRGDDAHLSDQHVRPAVAGTAPGVRVFENGQPDPDGSAGSTGVA